MPESERESRIRTLMVAAGGNVADTLGDEVRQ